MKKQRKRKSYRGKILSMLLSLCLLVGMLPMAALAVETSTSATVTVTQNQSLKDAFVNMQYESITELKVVTQNGATLTPDDFQFLSGVVVTPTDDGRYSSSYCPDKIECLKSLKTLDLSDAVCKDNAIPPRAFQKNTSITKIILPDTLERTYIHSFSMMENLTYLGTNAGNLFFPDSMRVMGEGMVYQCTKLSGSLTLPAGLTDIGSSCFYHSGISGKVTIPIGVNISKNTDIDSGEYKNSKATFAGTAIESLIFEDGVLSIPPFFSSDCSNLTSVIIPRSVTTIGEHAFSKAALKTFPEMEGVTSIRDYAFSNITTFENEIKLPAGIVVLGTGALAGVVSSQGLSISGRDIAIPDSFLQVSIDDSNVITGGISGSLSINNGITAIGDNAFCGNSFTGSVAIPSTVRRIGKGAFQYCPISSLTIADGVTNIGSSAFRKTNLEGTLRIPSSVAEIGVAAFSYAASLNNVVIENPDVSIGQYAFSNQRNDKDGVLIVYLPKTVDNTDWYSQNVVRAVTNGGTFAENTQFPTNSLIAPTKDGYTFNGWHANNNFIDNAEPTPAGGQAYYAKWTLEAPTVAVSADKTYIASGETATVKAAAEHKLAGVTYEYQWYTGTPDSGSAISGATNQTYTVNGLSSATTYYCKVTAVNGPDKSEAANSSSVTISLASFTGSVTITDKKTTATYGNEPFTFSYTASGAATVSSTNPSVATVSDNNGAVTVTIVGAGTTNIFVNFAGSGDYSSALNQFTLTVAKAALTITAENKSIYVGDALPSYTYKVSGLVGDDALATEPTVTCPTAGANTTGTYPITVSGADAGSNYTITYVDGILAVSSRPSGGGGGGSSGSSSGVSGSGVNVSVSAGGGSVSNSQMTVAVDKASEGATIEIKATSSTAVTLPVSGMKDAAANDNHVTVATRSGEVTLSAAAIEGLVEGASSSQSLQVSVTTATATAAGVEAGTPVFDVSVSVGSTAVHSFDGSLSITLTVSNLSKIEDPHVLHILADGTKQYLKPTVKGNQLTVSGIRKLSYFAVIPGSEVPAAPEPLPFTDVAADFWAYDAISYVYEKGLFAGTSETTFSPNVTMTREMLWTVLGRLSGAELTGAGVFEQARQWAVSNGVSDGTNGGNTITREQMVTMLYRYAGSPAAGGALTGYADASTVSGYAADAMAWAVGSGIISGTSATTLSPQGSATRAQVATILMRFVENTEK